MTERQAWWPLRGNAFAWTAAVEGLSTKKPRDGGADFAISHLAGSQVLLFLAIELRFRANREKGPARGPV